MNALRTLLFAAGFFVAFGASGSGELTTDTIDRWMAAMNEVQHWADDNDIDEQEIASGEGGMPDFVSAINSLGDERKGLERIAKAHDFENATDWAETSNRITRAFIAVEMDAQGTDMADVQRQMEQRMAQIENNDQMSDAQKQQMRQQMQAMQQNIRAAQKMTEDVPQADQQAVSARRDVLERFFESQQPQSR